MIAASLVATMLAVSMKGTAVEAQGMVAGAAAPGTMEGTFTVPYSEFDNSTPSGCGTTFAGCTGTLFECPTCVPHEINGTITVIDDCTFRVEGWQFDGVGPAVEWWGSKQDGDDETFPYPTNAIKIGELGAPGAYQLGTLHGGDSDIVVRLGMDDAGAQIEFSEDIDHISVWCEDYMVDFGNAPLECDGAAAAAATPEAGEAEAGEEEAESEEGAAASTTPEPSAVASMHSAMGAAAAVGALGLALL